MVGCDDREKRKESLKSQEKSFYRSPVPFTLTLCEFVYLLNLSEFVLLNSSESLHPLNSLGLPI